jgi:hypothetical protein
MSGLNRNLTALRDLRIIEVKGRKGNIENHALVFMVRGVHRKWKQPVTYYLSHGSSNAGMLKHFLDEVLGACHDVGLHVVATVCDMGTNNVSALRQMHSVESDPFFKFRNQEIATIYDPPHLLKCTRNLFRKYNVQFKAEHVVSQLPVIAKWEHIEKVYKQDKHGFFHTLYKLTDTHLAPVAHYSTKVSLAAQVMSYTVAAQISSLVTNGKEQFLH